MFISEAQAQVQGAAAAAGDGTSSMIMIGVMFLVMWLFILRPQSKRQQEHTSLITGLSRGDKIVTDSGIYAVITKVVDESILEVEIAADVKIRIVRNAVSAVLDAKPTKTKADTTSTKSKTKTAKKTTKKKAA
tara:strand:+ start:25888 stop:26286 length:399 start_codon:yes stop_codon:yes gene_type:complete